MTASKPSGESLGWRAAASQAASRQRQTARECRPATCCQGLSSAQGLTSAQPDLRRGVRLAEFTGSGASTSGYGIGNAVGASEIESAVDNRSREQSSASEQRRTEVVQSSGYSSEDGASFDEADEADRLPPDDDTEPDVADYIEDCQEKYGIEGLVEVAPGRAGLPYVYLRHPSGYTAEISMQGANVTSLLRPDGTDILFLMPGQQFDNLSPVKGGIPIVFPQYGRPDGLAARTGAAWHTLPINGFLNHMHWSMCESSLSPPEAYDPAPSVSFIAESDETTLSLWPHAFTAIYTVSLMYTDEMPDPRQPLPVSTQDADGSGESGSGVASTSLPDGIDPDILHRRLRPTSDPELLAGESRLMQFLGLYTEDSDAPIPVQLRCVLQILNTGEEQMMFAAGLQTHIAVNFLKYAELAGVASKAVLSSDEIPNKVRVVRQSSPSVTFGDERLDRVYVDTARPDHEDVTFHPGGYRYRLQLINRAGFRDLGVWNPHKKFPDSQVYRKFVALPQGAIAKPVKLEAGEAWEGEMVLRVHEKSHLFDGVPQGYESWEQKYQ